MKLTLTKTFLETLDSQCQTYRVHLPAAMKKRLGSYYELVEEWNPRLHVVAPCSASQFATRHVLESLYLLHHLPSGATVVDVGSGGGLPLIPCLIVRPDLRATLVESSKRKSVFLREALKRLEIEKSSVLAERFENVHGLKTGYVTCRALDRFEDKLAGLIEWSPPLSTLLLYGGNSLRRNLTKLEIDFDEELLPNSQKRFLFVAHRQKL